MSLWQRLQTWLGRQVLLIDRSTLNQLQNLAERQQRSKELVAADLLTMALKIQGVDEVNLQCWHNLSPREQQVAALICLNYTNSQIAARLNIAIPTVKTHVRNILRKFGLSQRRDLQHILAHWDFGSWENQIRT